MNWCQICQFKTDDFPANKIVEYITRDSLESLAYEIYDLKSKVHGLTSNINERRSQEGGQQSNLNLRKKILFC